MHRSRTWRLSLSVVFVAATILLAGGLAVGSNMGFKLNKPLTTAGANLVGNNWTSIPFNSPYVNLGGFCSQTGLPSNGASAATDTQITYRLAGGPFALIRSCSQVIPGGAGAPGPVFGGPAATDIPNGAGLQIRPGNAAGSQISIIIVGSHNPTMSITIPATASGAGNQEVGNVWFSVPYHTTAVTAHDLCVQMGIPFQPGSTTVGQGTVQVLNATTGSATPAACPGDGAKVAPFILELGKAIQIRYGVPLSFIPAHF